MRPQSTTQLVHAAAGGDRDAWNELIQRFLPLVWSIARGTGLSRADASDVSQTVCLRLVEKLGSLKEPEKLPAWLATIARRESLSLLRRGGREVPTPLSALIPDAPITASEDRPEDSVLADEGLRELLLTIESLPERCRVLLRALAVSPQPSYAEIAEALDIPIGSIGPTVIRCRKRLLNDLEAGHADAG